MELTVEVAWALPDRQVVVRVTVGEGATLRDAIARSGIRQQFPGIDLAAQRVGVFGKLKALDDPVEAGDRIEIYRPAVDPKELRRKRASSPGPVRPE